MKILIAYATRFGTTEKCAGILVAKGYFGYEMNWDKMNPMVRNIMQKASKTTEPVSKINTENIRKFAEEIIKVLT